MRKAAWHKLTIVDQVFHCDTSGGNCLTHEATVGEEAFQHPRMKQEIQNEGHDNTLFQLTDEMNRSLTEVSSKYRDRHFRILTTSRGLLLIWTAGPAAPDAQQKVLSDTEILEHLGLKDMLNDESHWYIFRPHGGHFHCVDPGASCIAPDEETRQFFLKPNLSQDKLNQVQDDSLSRLTDDFNYKLEEAARKRPDRNLRIVKTSQGMVLIWTDSSKHQMEDQPELNDAQLLEVLGLS
jgi:hypothetical protein